MKSIALKRLPKKSKHFMLRLHLVRENCRSLCFVPTDQNRADGLTKPLARKKYIQIFDAKTSISEGDDDFLDESDSYQMPCVVDYLLAENSWEDVDFASLAQSW